MKRIRAQVLSLLVASALTATVAHGQTTSLTNEKSTPSTGTLIVLNKDEASASLLDRATGKEFAKLDTGVGPHEVAVSPDGRFAVVGNYGAQQGGHTLSVIDLAAQSVVKTIDLVKYHRPHGMDLNPVTGELLVTSENPDQLIVIDLKKIAILELQLPHRNSYIGIVGSV